MSPSQSRLVADENGLTWSRTHRRPWPAAWDFSFSIPWSAVSEILVVPSHTAPVVGLVLRDIEAIDGLPPAMKRRYYVQPDRVFRLTLKLATAPAELVDILNGYRRAAK
jgi:hypothetical protein